VTEAKKPAEEPVKVEPVKVEPVPATKQTVAEPPKAQVEQKPEEVADTLAKYRELAVLRPDDALIRFNLGKSYLERGLVDQAVFELDMATSLDPKMTEGFLVLGRALRTKGQLDLAIAKLSAAIQLDPKFTEAYIELGICWDRRGFYQRARVAYNQALLLKPDDPTIYNNLGVSYFYEGNYEEALKQYKKALQIDPNNAQTNNNLAVIAAQRGEFGLAFDYFTRAHGKAVAHNNTGYLLLKAGNLDDAIKHLREAVKLRPDSTTALSNLEAALRMSGKIAEAEQVHTQYMKAVQAEAAAKK
jgi:Flp pilus assembly protein TadD